MVDEILVKNRVQPQNLAMVDWTPSNLEVLNQEKEKYKIFAKVVKRELGSKILQIATPTIDKGKN